MTKHGPNWFPLFQSTLQLIENVHINDDVLDDFIMDIARHLRVASVR